MCIVRSDFMDQCDDINTVEQGDPPSDVVETRWLGVWKPKGNGRNILIPCGKTSVRENFLLKLEISKSWCKIILPPCTQSALRVELISICWMESQFSS